ncbi:uncharacterized protein FOMMEDRAFT_154753 [Fomitiporia mediterranea MF3/22]|uniref:uncharacterized protein n=1 Tax=Fomitiporia mediterranea (strain MF3/22) TaxID=694068 RepID=UPI0004407D39|nr:uncharacterized protein FOMMEDRAFT_154753 [Fomitiporia mediterranea MF3/22]EJD03652.1 hypothetical protein FOMMEDRAFT_154753 [Fomitiporia mediterranea MF3/22]
MAQFATPTPPVRPQPAHLAIAVQETRGRYTHRPVDQFPWKGLKIPRHGFVVEPDWVMATFDNRRNDQFFDSKCLQTINEGTEVRFFHPYDTLGYSRDGVDFDVLEEMRQLDMHRHESFVERLFTATKSAVYWLVRENYLRSKYVARVELLPFACFGTDISYG